MKKFFVLAAVASGYRVHKHDNVHDHVSVEALEKTVMKTAAFQTAVKNALPTFCGAKPTEKCTSFLEDALFCLNFANKMQKMTKMNGYKELTEHCKNIDKNAPTALLSMPPITEDIESLIQAPPTSTQPKPVKR